MLRLPEPSAPAKPATLVNWNRLWLVGVAAVACPQQASPSQKGQPSNSAIEAATVGASVVEERSWNSSLLS